MGQEDLDFLHSGDVDSHPFVGGTDQAHHLRSEGKVPIHHHHLEGNAQVHLHYLASKVPTLGKSLRLVQLNFPNDHLQSSLADVLQE